MKPRRWGITLLFGILVLALVGAGAWLYAGLLPVGADHTHSRTEDWLLEAMRERSVSRAARAVEVRLPEVLEGDALLAAVAGYEDMCAGCHAPPGRSPSALARGLNPPAPDLARVAGERTPAELFWVTRHGIRMTGMPAWGITHSDDELWPLVALMLHFPELAEGEYERLLQEALAAGIEHHHDHDHDHDHDHGHDHGHRHDEHTH
jgi:hypothetical protein